MIHGQKNIKNSNKVNDSRLVKVIYENIHVTLNSSDAVLS